MWRWRRLGGRNIIFDVKHICVCVRLRAAPNGSFSYSAPVFPLRPVRNYVKNTTLSTQYCPPLSFIDILRNLREVSVTSLHLSPQLSGNRLPYSCARNSNEPSRSTNAPPLTKVRPQSQDFIGHPPPTASLAPFLKSHFFQPTLLSRYSKCTL